MKQENIDLTAFDAAHAFEKRLPRLRGILDAAQSLGVALLFGILVSFPMSSVQAGITCADFSGFKAKEIALPDFSVGSFKFHHIDGQQLSQFSGNALQVKAYGIEIRLPDQVNEVHLNARSGNGTFLVIGHNGAQVVGHFTVFYANGDPSQDYKMTAPLIARLIIVGGSGEAAISSICATSP